MVKWMGLVPLLIGLIPDSNKVRLGVQGLFTPLKDVTQIF
jgi:hypothetical protein